MDWHKWYLSNLLIFPTSLLLCTRDVLCKEELYNNIMHVYYLYI